MSSHGQILAQAVARNAAVVLSLPSAGMLRHHKSRFLGEEDGALWVQGLPQEAGLVRELIAHQQRVGVALRSGEMKILFTTVPVRHEAAYRLGAGTEVDALLLRAPESVQVVQRRGNYRVRHGERDSLAVRVWRLTEQAVLEDVPPRRQELAASLRDLSVSGAGLIAEAGLDPRLVVDERLRVELRCADEVLLPAPLLLEGRVRFVEPRAQDGPVRAGVKFVSLQSDLAGRAAQAALEKIVGWLEREELRRSRGAEAGHG